MVEIYMKSFILYTTILAFMLLLFIVIVVAHSYLLLHRNYENHIVFDSELT